MPTRVIHVRVTDDQMNKITEMANGRSVGEFIRSRVFDTTPAPVESPRRPTVIVEGHPVLAKLPVGVTRGMPKAGAKLCPHGVEKGWNCWQCGGMAKA
jgi:hypothetical protein